MKQTTIQRNDTEVSQIHVHTLVIGSGASGLNTAVQCHSNGITDLLIISEGLDKGTSINTGSDKQTYYKLSMCGKDADAPEVMAETYFDGGSMHGDIALVEASLSARGFLHLVNLGVPFPRDAFGQFVGYKTDHDPRQRATSIGPYTSREMCRALIREVQRRDIPVHEGIQVVQLLTMEQDGSPRAIGALAIDAEGKIVIYTAENVVFAVGGPGGLYKTSVYPEVHTGAIGLALMAGAKAQNLTESQYGMASIKFRWNVSGTYMQVIPRFISTDEHGNDTQEFMREYFDSVGEMNSMIFLKGYQWPFDWRKVRGGSSIVDILVYIETVIKGRHVFLDFRENPAGFSFADLSEEARTYLEKSDALLESPIMRLKKMNPGAIELYDDHGIDITVEPLEIAVCAQHNNGGLTANMWWESDNTKHLFPVGEVNGSHGVYRPGGAALNSGQVGGFRVAEYIANRYADHTIDETAFHSTLQQVLDDLLAWLKRSKSETSNDWQTERDEFQSRMSRAGAHIRSLDTLIQVIPDAWKQVKRLQHAGDATNITESLRNRQLCFAHAVYLEALKTAMESGVGSRGSSIALDPQGEAIHQKLGQDWHISEEDVSYRSKVLETVADAHTGNTTNTWVTRRSLPQPDSWFETSWARYREGTIYDETPQ